MELKCLLSGETPTGSDSSETTLVREIRFWFLMISNLIWAWVRSIKKFKWNTEICEEKRFYFMCKVCGRKIWKNHPDSRPVLSSWIPNPHIVYLCICVFVKKNILSCITACLPHWHIDQDRILLSGNTQISGKVWGIAFALILFEIWILGEQNKLVLRYSSQDTFKYGF